MESLSMQSGDNAELCINPNCLKGLTRDTQGSRQAESSPVGTSQLTQHMLQCQTLPTTPSSRSLPSAIKIPSALILYIGNRENFNISCLFFFPLFICSFATIHGV